MRAGSWTVPWLGLQFAPPVLPPWMWAVLAGIPVGIIALYFLKLRRKPVQVPSTLLWRRSIEDLHVNSLFQRLRRNLLLFLQLLIAALAIAALLGPQMLGSSRSGQRDVITIDNSGSMSSTDVPEGSRLERAKAEARKIVDSMGPNDLAMVISFSDSAQVVSTYTGNKSLLRTRIESIRPTTASTSLREALEVAAGLANPAQQIDVPQGVVASEYGPPKLMVFTDGGFPDVSNFSLGKLQPEVVVIGTGEPLAPSSGDAAKKNTAESPPPSPPSDNIAIVGLQSARNEDQPDKVQVFGRLRNYRAEPASVSVQLFRVGVGDDGKPIAPQLIDAIDVSLDKGSAQAFKFDLVDQGDMQLEARIDPKDALPIDDRAYLAITRPRKAQVLVATDGNKYLTGTLATTAMGDLADVAVVTGAQLAESSTQRDLAAGRYDLVIFDNLRPSSSPAANTIYLGTLPPEPGYQEAKQVEGPVILDWDISHPILQYVRDLSLVRVLKATIVEPPPGSSRLVDSNAGSLMFVAPRSGFSDLVVAFPIFSKKAAPGADAGKAEAGPGEFDLNTDWQTKYSFPLFLFNAIRVLGNATESEAAAVHRPGEPVILRADRTATSLEVVPPGDGRAVRLERTPQGTFVFTGAQHAGVYQVRWGESGRSAFAVNLFDERESDIAPRGLVPAGVSSDAAEAYKIKIGNTTLGATRRVVPSREDWWKVLAALALGVVLVEWYIYNRRVYV